MTKIEINLDGEQGNKTFIMAMVKAYLISTGKIYAFEAFLNDISGKNFDYFIRESIRYCPVIQIQK